MEEQSAIFYGNYYEQFLEELKREKKQEIDLTFGNFSFINSYFIRESMTFDCNYFVKMGAWELLKLDKKTRIEDILFWETMKSLCYPKHTWETYYHNLFLLEFIAVYGWTPFIILYINI